MGWGGCLGCVVAGQKVCIVKVMYGVQCDWDGRKAGACGRLWVWLFAIFWMPDGLHGTATRA